MKCGKCGHTMRRKGHACPVCLPVEIRDRLKQGFTQAEVARQLGFTHQHISRVLQRARQATGKTDELL